MSAAADAPANAPGEGIETLTGAYLRAHALPEPEEGSKDERGRVLIVAGSVEVPGAASLAGTAAMRAGAGKLQLAAPRSLALHLGFAVPEALVAGLDETPAGGVARGAAPGVARRAGRCHAVLVGPGMAEEEDCEAFVAGLLAEPGEAKFVLDAAALGGVKARPDLARALGDRAVLTPHAGEMARLLDRERDWVEQDPLRAARDAVERFGAVVVMKGAETFIVAPDGTTLRYQEGHVGLATSGSGDVLAGLLVGFLARGAEPAHAAAWGVYVHGEAGRRLGRRIGRIGFLARELADEAPGIVVETLA